MTTEGSNPLPVALARPATTEQWQVYVDRLQIDSRPFISGARRKSTSNDNFVIRNPFTSQIVAEVPCCDHDDVDLAVQTAVKSRAESSWTRQSAALRADVLRTLATKLESNADELAALDSIQMGMPITFALDDIGLAARKLREAAATAERLHDVALPSASASLALNQRVPQGVVGAITPWNFPLFVALSKVGPALAMGNAVVLKPSELAPLACLRLAELAVEAGVPEGIFNVVPGLGFKAGQALTSHAQVNMVSFTGSTATGRKLMHCAADSNLKALHLELGGKSPQIVLDDCGDIRGLAQALADGFMFNGGQLCVAGSRLLIADNLIADLLPLIVECMGAWRPGNPLDPETCLGPLASAGHFDRVTQMINDAVQSGYESHHSPSGGGILMPTPTLFAGVPAASEIAQEEVFGPVAAAIAFNTDAEALELANGTRYGLVATVWSGDLARGMRLAEQVNAGGVTVNTKSKHAPPRVVGASLEPYGESGYGAEGGADGLLAFTRARHLLVNLPT